MNDECPIRLEQFVPNDTVTQIRHCGHIFNSTELTNWFRTNTRCPVCRYDLVNSRRNAQSNANSNDIYNLMTDIIIGAEDYNYMYNLISTDTIPLGRDSIGRTGHDSIGRTGHDSIGRTGQSRSTSPDVNLDTVD